MKYTVPRIWMLLLALCLVMSFTPASAADNGQSVVSVAPVFQYRGEVTARARVRLVVRPLSRAGSDGGSHSTEG